MLSKIAPMSKRRVILALTAALALVAGAVLFSGHTPNSTATPGLQPVATGIAATVGCVGVYQPDGSVDVHCPPIAAGPTTPPATTPPATTAPATTPPATTPPPTSTPPSGPLTGCLAHPSACGWPDATNTGAHGTLTAFTGNRSVPANGLLENVAITGCLNVGNGATIRNVTVACSSGGYSIVGSGFTITDSTITCGNRPGSTGVGDANFTATRLDISLCENGFDVDTKVTVVDSYVHQLSEAADNHSDGAQVDASGGAGSAITFRHNTLDARTITTSAIIAYHCACTGLTVAGNLLAGGAFTLYCPNASAGASSGTVVSGNRFVGGEYGYASDCGRAGVAWSGNVSDVTGATLGAQ